MFYPDLEFARKLSQDHNIIPVSMEVYADMETPISLFKRFEDGRYCYLLESVEGGEKWARFSFIGRNPFLVVRSSGGTTSIEPREGPSRVEKGNPVEIIKGLMKEYRGAKLPGIPRFNGGAVGYFGYDLARYGEDLPDIPEDDLKLPECYFMFTDEVIAFDHLKQKIHIIVNMKVDGNIERAYNTVTDRIREIYREITSASWKAIQQVPLRRSETEPTVKSNISMEKFCENVKRAIEYIKDGDIFQVVLSQRLEVESDREPFNVYRVLRGINPSPYMFYLKLDGLKIAGASPEMLVRVEDGRVETCPIAGTRKRGRSAEEDLQLERELLEDGKELAEHTMLVDLGRNDIGKVSEFGSVRVRDFMHIERYSHVMHIVSNVEGRLKKGLTAFDALMSTLPAGTLSGAPKVRAMEIIDELETTKRGVYAGAIGYLGFEGSLDSCIAIRTIVFKEKKAYIQAGAGIVADSVPELEYQESINKAMALLKAIKEAGDIR